MALNSNALTTVDNVQAWLKIPDSEMTPELTERLEALINASSQSIEELTQRVLVLTEHIEFQDGRRNDKTVLRQGPIIQIKELWIDGGQDFTDSRFQLDPSEYAVIDDDTAVQLLKNRLFASGTYNVKIIYDAGYADIPSDLVQACNVYVEWMFAYNERQDVGRLAKTKGDESSSIQEEIPALVKTLIGPYVRYEFSAGPTGITNG